MLAFITDNLATILVSAVIVAIVALIIFKMRSDKKKGKSIKCGGNCKGCIASSLCDKE